MKLYLLATSLADQALRTRNPSGVLPRPGIRRYISGIISTAGASENTWLLILITISLIVLIVLIALTVREYLFWKRRPR